MCKHSNSEAIASWKLSSLVCRLSTISTRLRGQVDICYQLIETKMHNKLLNLFRENHTDNQEVLEMFFALKDDLPLKDCSSQAKLGMSELKNKVVILLITRAELLPIEVLLLLAQQMFDRAKLDGSYEIVWVPIASSDTWTCAEEESFDFLSNSLPWFSIRQPWLLSSIVVKFIKLKWNFNEEPLMVILDKQGMVTNSNAFDMTLIWGPRAYPFSISRENELWEGQTWNLQLLLDGIDPKVAKWVEEDQNLCIYGSDDLDWIREFIAKMREIVSSGLQFKMVYVGKKNPSENIRRVIGEEKMTGSLTLTKINFFWLRLESMRRSKLRLGHTDDKDPILKQLSGLLDTDESEKGWVIMGRGCSTDIVKLQGREVIERLELFPVWGEKVTIWGLVGAIRTAIEPALLAEPCHHSNVVPFVEGLKDTLFCEKCKRPMEKFVVYKCNGTE
ncbi:Protein SIEVE ELEMENT OCCLUSION C like [Actinidia chinensis var. chinensis]|uniref:Protein SIEVE ELEMENT OCCLUSION C like n=1 Tax=Actinidia chinensis var. chinensis TaxID=1590841 RepID=A0A2R6REC2_ACTCC|nr:Protein SIEVE ELEMENT OCCLUSION C like [Actinidia chinensis var. chinensis]